MASSVILVQADLPAHVTSVYSPEDEVVVVSTTATPADVARAWEAATRA